MDWVETEYEGFYINQDGEVLNDKTGKILTPYLDERGCYRVSLWCNGVHKNPKIHLMLARAFIPRPYNATGVIFIDGDKSNYSLDNLDWRVPKSKVKKEVKDREWHTEKDVRVRKKRKTAHGVVLYHGSKELAFDSVFDAADFLECTKTSVYNALAGRTWTVCGWKVRWDYEERPIYIKGVIK
jgi:hypothetical protein